jgi:Holliday junction DNA helicase RuvA
MIGYLKGKVLDRTEGRCLLAVGDAAGAVGYSVQVPAALDYESLRQGQTAEFHVHTHVREDALDLYGFLRADEKELFLALMTVNGIGPRVALSVLSCARPEEFVRAVMEGDKGFLTDIPGIGKKTAERLVLELADPIAKRVEQGRLRPAPGRGKGSAAAASGATARPGGAAWNDAVQALLGLGYREPDALALLDRVVRERGEAEVPTGAEEWVRAALQRKSP